MSSLNLTLTIKDKLQQYAPAGTKHKIFVPKGERYLHNSSGGRKSTGSYFTKHFAVECPFQHALEAPLAERLQRLNAGGRSRVGALRRRFKSDRS